MRHAGMECSAEITGRRCYGGKALVVTTGRKGIYYAVQNFGKYHASR
ncbi:MAG: hypothetical protein K2K70_06295 [Lachnospiraceae bacterium]|nr:hypothetical protein [Lachnospiraceae bacterium]